MHHRLFKQVILDPPKSHCIPSPAPVPSYSPEALRSIVFHHRQAYRSTYSFHPTRSKNARLSNHSYDTYVDESQTNVAAYQYREYTINEFNIPEVPSFDDDMINFLLEMQNRDLYVFLSDLFSSSDGRLVYSRSPEDYEMLLRLDERVQRRTLNANVFESLPTVAVNESHVDDQCSICMEKYILGQDMKLLPCAHIFHSTCIETYLKEFSIQCPLDNLPLTWLKSHAMYSIVCWFYLESLLLSFSMVDVTIVQKANHFSTNLFFFSSFSTSIYFRHDAWNFGLFLSCEQYKSELGAIPRNTRHCCISAGQEVNRLDA